MLNSRTIQGGQFDGTHIEISPNDNVVSIERCIGI